MKAIKNRVLVLALLAACVAVPSATAFSGSTHSASHAVVKRGGILRMANTSLFFTDAFDPTGEYTTPWWGIYNDMLLRTLMSYKHVLNNSGTVVVPDLATSPPKVTDGGTVYTFTLKSGVRFSPPVNRVITSKDVAYAFERMATASVAAEYPFYYGVIKGFTVHGGTPRPISGITTPNAHTIVFHLVKPVGDFVARLTLPATAPIPPEVGKCFLSAGAYGRDVIASGPYMVAGSQKVNIKSCSTIKPMSGFQPTTGLSLVRNPNWSRSTDPIRPAYIDGLQVSVDSNLTDIYNKIRAGEIDITNDYVPPVVIQQYVTNPSLRPMLHDYPTTDLQYLSMNLTQPPFDDVHVRKAVNYILDKAAIQRALGGPVYSPFATHITPDVLLGNKLENYDPYATPDHAGDLAKAQAEMKLSKYDPSKDGMCDVSACKGILDLDGGSAITPILQADLAKIGITLTVRDDSNPFASESVPSKAPALFWFELGSDYPDAYSWFGELDSSEILASGNFNTSLVGLTPSQASSFGVTGSIQNVPSVDADNARCEKLIAVAARQSCFAAIDKKLMTQIVPWAPWGKTQQINVVSSAVTQFIGDEADYGTPSLARIALDPSKQKH